MKKLIFLTVLALIAGAAFSQPPTPPDTDNYYAWYAAICMGLYMAGYGTKWLILAWKNKRLANKK